MIARLSRNRRVLAVMDDQGTWRPPSGSPDLQAISDSLNSLYNPNDRNCTQTADHHAPFGRLIAGRAATDMGLDVEFTPADPPPDDFMS